MAELFNDQERLDDLLKEVPKELTAKLRQARQIQSKLVRQIPTLERKRADAEKLTEQVRNMLDGLRELAEDGDEQVRSQIETASESAETVAQELTSNAENIVTEVDGVEDAADTLRTTLAALSSRTSSAAQTATAGLTSFEESSRAAMTELQNAKNTAQTGIQELGRTVEEAQVAVTGAVEALRQRVTETVANSGESAAATMQTFAEMADQHRASLDGLSGRLSAWTTTTAEDNQERLTGEVQAPLQEKLEEIPRQIEDIEALITEVGEDARSSGEQLASGFTSLRERAQNGRRLAEQVLELADTLNA